MLAQQNILCYNTPNNIIAVVEFPELDLVAPRVNAEGDAMNTTMPVSTLTATELPQLAGSDGGSVTSVVEESSLVSTSAIPAIEDLSSSICKSYD